MLSVSCDEQRLELRHLQVPILNAIGIDCAVAGNHDFDWSAPHFSKLAKDSNYVRVSVLSTLKLTSFSPGY